MTAQYLDAQPSHESPNGGRAIAQLGSIAELTGALAHDLATPITAIQGYAELIEKSVGDEKNRKRAATIIAQLERVNDLIDNLSELAQPAGTPRPLELAELVDEALAIHRERIDECHIAIERIGTAPSAILAERRTLGLALQRLLSLALDSVPRGATLRLSLSETANGEVEMRVASGDQPSETPSQARIDEARAPSGRAADASSRKLLVARILVQGQGGALARSSDPELGDEFLLTFPLFTRPSEEA